MGQAAVRGRIRGWQREVYYVCFRAVLRVRCRYADAVDARSAGAPDQMPLPPALLRYRVSEDLDPDLFIAVGERTSQNIQAALMQTNRPPGDFRSILDFGCGCGRTLTFPDAARLPRLAYRQEAFDLVYATSVFTHSDRDRQEQWPAVFASQMGICRLAGGWAFPGARLYTRRNGHRGGQAIVFCGLPAFAREAHDAYRSSAPRVLRLMLD